MSKIFRRPVLSHWSPNFIYTESAGSLFNIITLTIDYKGVFEDLRLETMNSEVLWAAVQRRRNTVSEKIIFGCFLSPEGLIWINFFPLPDSVWLYSVSGLIFLVVAYTRKFCFSKYPDIPRKFVCSVWAKFDNSAKTYPRHSVEPRKSLSLPVFLPDVFFQWTTSR